ncbi:mitogillin family ribonuclease Hirsutellin [Aspergillus oryzae 100-8]|uniref:Mitogillin family ribonuclease Hirsutellin n=1 Tax=Aspergillus oryzae (strain 3.042) TaxID=1160506 RepID=I8AC84_ASPO3|nr:mitogillin family ribonuclease Hirsutellin [Aspergillus oryzae 3.042]KDE83389.1 mitogillin family ribonuclease Hirsutellin [Aspergillus oryzae 100-8]RAQ41041.1 mitogillin family ribonuclease Hirsutellin [Aspergillus flavus]|eukprot:EIT83062.1 mitogillin family ribonuclease Hirsutellin [Aspergillus oryzae 3.042]
MQLTKAILALALVVSPVLAAPTEVGEGSVNTNVEARAVDTVSCTPDQNQSGVKFEVDVQAAKALAQKIGWTTDSTKSDYPHPFGDKEKLWAHIPLEANKCNSKTRMLEYPVYWTKSKVKEWDPSKKKKEQQKTPIRIVYSNLNGALHYCGAMIHKTVAKDFGGSGDFKLCQ